MRYRHIIDLIGSIASLSPNHLFLERRDVDPSGLKEFGLRGRVRFMRFLMSHISEAVLGDVPLGPPDPLLVEAHILILLLQPSLSVGKICRTIQLLIGGRDLWLEVHPACFDRRVLLPWLISHQGGVRIGGPWISHSSSCVNELRVDSRQLPRWLILGRVPLCDIGL